MYYCDCDEFVLGSNGYDCKHTTGNKECLVQHYWEPYCPHYLHHDADPGTLYRLYGPFKFEEIEDGESMRSFW